MALDLVARMWACKAGRRGSGLAELDREVWANGLVTCFWACKAGLRVGWAVYVWACRLLGRVVELTRLLCADWAR